METKLIDILSSLPVEALNDIRMMAAILRNQEQNKRFDLWVHRCNQALEQKDQNYYTQFEHVTDNNTLFT